MASRPESSVKISASHAEKLCVTLLPKLCSETDLGEFCKLVAGVGFTPHDQEKVYAAVASRCEAVAHDSVRCANVRQDWDFRDHLPAHIWTALPSDSGHTQLLSFLKSLGMWNPAEPILQLVSGILMISTDQAHLSDSAKNQHLKCVKSWWQKIKGKDIAPTPYLDILPDIHKLKSRFPLLYEKVYSEGEPIMCPIASTDVEIILSGTWARLHQKKTTPNVQATMDTQSVQGIVQQTMQSMMQCFMPMVQGMMQPQMQMGQFPFPQAGALQLNGHPQTTASGLRSLMAPMPAAAPSPAETWASASPVSPVAEASPEASYRKADDDVAPTTPSTTLPAASSAATVASIDPKPNVELATQMVLGAIESRNDAKKEKQKILKAVLYVIAAPPLRNTSAAPPLHVSYQRRCRYMLFFAISRSIPTTGKRKGCRTSSNTERQT